MRSLEYLAGFFDGEGCIHAQLRGQRTSSVSVKLNVTNTFRPVLDEFVLRFGGRIYEVPINKGSKRIYRWYLDTRVECVKFLLALRPHLWEKQRQADIALDILSIKFGVMDGNVDALAIQLRLVKKDASL